MSKGFVIVNIGVYSGFIEANNDITKAIGIALEDNNITLINEGDPLYEELTQGDISEERLLKLQCDYKKSLTKGPKHKYKFWHKSKF